MNKKIIDLWVGIFVLLGFFALVILALKVGNLTPSDQKTSYILKVYFDNIGGLKIRAPVRASGVTVGRIKSIAFDTNKYQALVQIAINKNYKFPKDTTAAVLTSGILGENYIGLEAGGDTNFLKNGDFIELTQSAIVLETLIGQFLYGKAQEQNTLKKP